MVVRCEADPYFDRKLADETLGDDLGFMSAVIPFGKRLSAFVLDLHTVVIYQSEACPPAEMRAEQSCQVFGKKCTCAAESSNGDQRVVRISASRSMCRRSEW